MTEKSKKSSFVEGLKNPNSYVIILTLIIVCMVLTWIVPSGSYERVQDPASGKTVVDPASFHYVEDKSVNLFDMLKAIPKGISTSGGIIIRCRSFFYIIHNQSYCCFFITYANVQNITIRMVFSFVFFATISQKTGL